MLLHHCFETEARCEYVPYCFTLQVNQVPSPTSLPQQKTDPIYLKEKKKKIDPIN